MEVSPNGRGKAGFNLMNPRDTGVWFTNVLKGDAAMTNAVAHNGSGVAIGDVDGDDRPDIYLCGLQGPNRLYRNLGDWRFEEIAQGAAACAEQLSTGATLADVDGDRDLDLLVNGIAAGTRLFLNDGKGRWTESETSGLSRTASSTSLALADIDGDGDLDLYCTHYIDVMYLADPTTRFALARRNDTWEVTKVNGESARLARWKDRFEALPDGKVRELPEVHGLYRNDGHGQFTPIQFDPGVFSNEQGAAIPPYRDWGLAVMFRDLNGDRAPDLYVCNDNASPDRVWLNSGRGTFRAIDPLKFRHTSRSSMGVDIADLDRDGHDDILVLDMLAREHGKRMTQLVRDSSDPRARERVNEQPRYNRNTLFLGRADGSFAEAAFMAGVAATDWSWCPVFIDVDLDGYEDLLVTNGFSFDVMDQDSHDQLRTQRLSEVERKRYRRYYPSFLTQNASFRNRGDRIFEPMNSQWGFDQRGVSNGMALGDLDQDGDLDVVVNNLNDVAGLYRNDATRGRIAVRLRGLPPNAHGIGARLRLIGSSMTQSQEMIAGGRYMSGDQSLRVFAADSNFGKPMRLEVTWRSGRHSFVANAVPNRLYEIDEAGAAERLGNVTESRSDGVSARENPKPEIANLSPLFQEVSHWLGHVHVEDSFDDWERQPLLPRRLSRLGPGLSWYDWNDDGWEDLAVTAGRGGTLAIYTNDHGKTFRRIEGIPPAHADQGAALGWPDGRGKRSLLVPVSNYEMRPNAQSEITVYSVSKPGAPEHRSAGRASLGPVAAADLDSDGDLDIFVGGRFQPGRYPEPVASFIWRNEQGELRPDAALSQPFESLGLVSGATFCDLDGDGDPDLALALEWGPLRCFLNEKGILKEWNPPITVHGERSSVNGQPSTLNQLPGWWTCVTTGDFDGDGRLDLAAGNWGRNTPYELYRPSPLRLYYDDGNGDGNVLLLEAWKKGTQWLPVRDRNRLALGFPELQQRFATHQSYGEASVWDILGSRFDKAKAVEAAHFESTVFLNRGSHFDQVLLPREAQLSPALSINVGDCDGDGIEDLFLSQNFFGSVSDLSREDSGRGLWLRGLGNGTFAPMDASVTGIQVEGEQRGAALADFNHDGRVDVAVSQNSASTKLYLNQGAKRGIRVVLQGPIANPDAVGAQMRVRYKGGRAGPCRTITAGSGYWSQDGAAQILGVEESPVALWIRWPGGREQTVPLEDARWEFHVKFE
ncbi:MAG: VCBS repeat-containing protein [Verrucomicrobia bacterium]|nr:VCBS repeat-containing protein [Verrucomicrobiota bacterium]